MEKKFEIPGYGEVIVELNLDGHVDIKMELNINLLAEVKKLAEKTATPVDDAAIAWLEKLVALVP